MIIDIYTLLGMIKDGKAPRKIVFKEDIYEYRCSEYSECIDYYCDNDGSWLFEDYEITSILNDEVTILETTITYKPDKIEKLDLTEVDGKIYGTYATYIDIAMGNKINEIIDKMENKL